jgi:hypothetical protein
VNAAPRPRRWQRLPEAPATWPGLGIINAAAFNPTTCKKVNAIGLRVSPPNNTTSTIVSFPFAACSKKGPVFLSEGVVLAGVGVPDYNL